jgi:capsular polysaccharide biosynthesis protein
VKRVGAIAAFVLVGLAAGALWTLLQSDRYRADARVLVRPTSAGVVPAVQALAESSLVETNVAQTLHLSSAPDLSAQPGDGGVLTVSAEAASGERARQIDAEAIVILAQKVRERFSAVGATATVLDPAHVAEQTSPTPGRNVLITTLAGLVVGIAAAAVLSSGRQSHTTVADPRVERRLQARIAQVTQRERSLAQRAGQLAAREQDLERREDELAAAAAAEPARAPERQPQAPESKPEPAPHREQKPEPEPEPALEAEPPQAATSQVPAPGRWTLQALEELSRDRTRAGASAAQQEEWSTYLFLLREHAGADGSLPSSFDPLVADVFGPLPQPD